MPGPHGAFPQRQRLAAQAFGLRQLPPPLVQPGKILQPPSRLRLVVRHQRQGMAEVLLGLLFLAPAQCQGPQAAQERRQGRVVLPEVGAEPLERAAVIGLSPLGLALELLQMAQPLQDHGPLGKVVL